jgi:hypothetical protein
MIRELLTSAILSSCASTYIPATPWTTPIDFDMPKGAIVQLNVVSKCDSDFCLDYKTQAFEAWKQVLEDQGFIIYSESSALEETQRKNLLDGKTKIPNVDFYRCEYIIFPKRFGKNTYPESSLIYCTLNGVYRTKVRKEK